MTDKGEIHGESSVTSPAAPADRPTVRVGFVGLGNQGAPIARRIAAGGWPLSVWARRPETLAPFADCADRFDSAESFASQCDILCICVLDDAGATEVVTRMLPALRPGSLIAIMSTVHPDTCIALAEQVALRGVALIDAPVSGGGDAALAGTLTVMMGGAEADCRRAEPVFRSFGGLVVRLGELGAGQRTKLINNALLAAILDVTQDARELGAELGLEPALLDKVLQASSGGSIGLDLLARLPGLSALAHGALLLRKDVRLLDALCGKVGLSVPPLIDAGLRFVDRVDAAR